MVSASRWVAEVGFDRVGEVFLLVPVFFAATFLGSDCRDDSFLASLFFDREHFTFNPWHLSQAVRESELSSQGTLACAQPSQVPSGWSLLSASSSE